MFHYRNIKKDHKITLDMVCVKCGASEAEVELFDAIGSDKIVKICKRCNFHEQLPILRKPKQPDPVNVKQVNSSKRVLSKHELNLKEIVDKQYSKKSKKSSLDNPDFVPNFHWILMRTRRNRGITVTKFAELMRCSTQDVELAERGYLPDTAYDFLRRAESVLGVRLIKKAEEPVVIPSTPEELIRTVVPEKKPGFFGRLFGGKKKEEVELVVEEGLELDPVDTEDLK